MNSPKTSVSVYQLKANDFEKFTEVIRLFEEVFEMNDFSIPAPQHLQKLLGRSDFLVFTAVMNNQIVGGLTAYVLEQYYSEKPLAYLYDLAVDTNYQRQGIGKMLIAEVNKYCAENGFEEVFVQADKIDDYAIDFYRLTKPTIEEEVVHFSYLLDKK